MISVLRHVLEGFAIGVANVIPGVSGGTMALIFGIYRAIISAVSDAVHAGLLLLRGDFKGFVAAVRVLPWGLLAPLAVGVLLAPLMGAGLVEHLLSTYPEQMRGLFFGLIAGSLAIPWLHANERGVRAVVLAVLSGALAFYLSGLPAQEITDPGFVAVFFAASVAVSAMILPGVSGAYLLLVIGMYRPLLQALETLDIPFLAVFGLGCAVGLGAFALLLNRLLKTRHDETMAVLVGLMAGSLRALWPWQLTDRTLLAPGDGWAMVVGVGAIGLLVSVAMTAWDIRRRRLES